MFPVITPEKIRPVINLSFPEGLSFNDNVPKIKLRKVRMATARYISQLIRKCAGQAIISKFDHKNAYKLIPCRMQDIKYQAFRFLGKIFFETKQIFGSIPAVAHYDDLHLLLVMLTLKHLNTYINPAFLARVLDDLVVVSNSMSEMKTFTRMYTSLAAKLDIKLAPFTGTKAYIEEDSGVALGIIFSGPDMTWALPQGKKTKYTNLIITLLNQVKVNEQQLEEIVGVINYVMTLSPMLRFLRHHIYEQLKEVQKLEDKQIILSLQARSQLMIWYTIVKETESFPIPRNDPFPPIAVITLLSDAAGKAKNASLNSPRVGAASVTFIYGKSGHILRAAQAFFPEALVTTLKDQNNIRFGDKSTYLELCAMLLGVIHNLDFLQGKQVLLQTDSLPAIWAMEKGRSKTCLYVSTLTLAIATLLQSSETFFYLQHVPRLSSYEAVVSDALTRQDNTGKTYATIMGPRLRKGWPVCFQNWLSNPQLDDSIGAKIWTEIQSKI